MFQRIFNVNNRDLGMFQLHAKKSVFMTILSEVFIEKGNSKRCFLELKNYWS